MKAALLSSMVIACAICCTSCGDKIESPGTPTAKSPKQPVNKAKSTESLVDQPAPKISTYRQTGEHIYPAGQEREVTWLARRYGKELGPVEAVQWAFSMVFESPPGPSEKGYIEYLRDHNMTQLTKVLLQSDGFKDKELWVDVEKTKKLKRIDLPTGLLIQEVYQHALGRPAGPSEIEGWKATATGENGYNNLLDGILGSPEFTDKVPRVNLSSLNSDLSTYRLVLADFFQACAEVAQSEKAAGKNAVSSKFRDRLLLTVRDFQDRNKHPRGLEVTPQDRYFKRIDELLIDGFAQSIDKATNHTASWLTSSKITWNWTKRHLVELGQLIGFATQAASGNEMSEEQRAQIAAGVSNALKSIENDEMVDKGTHASGWLAVNLKEDAINVERYINNNRHKVLVGQSAVDLSDTIGQTCVSLQQLQTEGHDVWLQPSWQVQFYAVCTAAAAKLRSLK